MYLIREGHARHITQGKVHEQNAIHQHQNIVSRIPIRSYPTSGVQKNKKKEIKNVSFFCCLNPRKRRNRIRFLSLLQILPTLVWSRCVLILFCSSSSLFTALSVFSVFVCSLSLFFLIRRVK